MRLQKYMADAGVASRRKCEELISEGRVSVNGATASIGCTVEPGRDIVIFDGKRLEPAGERVLIAFNKPAGVVCTSDDPEGRETVLDYFKDLDLRIYNVGRLDYDSEGLIIMTNDGELAYRMAHPKFMLDKTYHTICAGKLTREEADMLRHGVMLDDGMTRPAKLSELKCLSNGNTMLDITIHEGRNREVRRMLDAVGHSTLLLRRTKIGPIELGSLPIGKWRYVSETERAALEQLLD